MRKGQFFIISAVVILLVLFGMYGSLGREWGLDVSEVQGNDINAIFTNLEDGLKATVAASSPQNLEANLNRFAVAEKNTIKERYEFDISYNITSTQVLANATFKSADFYAEKMIDVPR